jgi:hypothetical protein
MEGKINAENKNRSRQQATVRSRMGMHALQRQAKDRFGKGQGEEGQVQEVRLPWAEAEVQGDKEDGIDTYASLSENS